MPHTKSAKKNLRKTEKRRLHNRAIKKTIRTHLKRFQAALTGPAEALQAEFKMAVKKLDKAAARGIIHRNLAARKKSQMARLMLKKQTPPAATDKPAS